MVRSDNRIEQLIHAALHDKGGNTREHAANALRDLGDNRATDMLVNATKNGSHRVRAYAVEALGIIGDVRAVEPLIQALKDRSKVVRIHAAQALEKLGSPLAIEPLIAALHDKEHLVSALAARALARLKTPRAIEPLFDLVENGSERQIYVVTMELIHLGDESIAQRFIALLKSHNQTTRLYAAHAVGQMHCREAVPALIGMLQEQDEKVRSAAIQALGEIGDLRVFEPLVELVNDPIANWVAERALGQLKDSRAIPALIHALKIHKRRSNFAEAVSYIGEPVIQSLLDLLTSKRAFIRRNAVNALCQLWLRQPKLHSIIQMSTVMPVIGALHDKDLEVRRSAVNLLSFVADKRAIEPLINLLQSEQYPKVRLDIVIALGEFTDSHVIEILTWVGTHDHARTKWDSGWERGEWVKISDQATRILERVRSRSAENLAD